jgi:exopolyphosphatase/guanosine-5'-triphosphate,3'-diphosphate pyrophosphatase
VTALEEATAEAIARVQAATANWADDHVRRVELLAVRLYRELDPFHGLGPDEEVLLRAGALLHDVGYPVDPDKHHKISARIIREHLGPPFQPAQVELIALLARYHRKGLPKLRHDRYRALDERGRRLVRWLGGILRVADGLDRSHADQVGWLGVAISEARVDIRVAGADPALRRDARVGLSSVSAVDLREEVGAAMKKRDLLERAVGMPVLVRAV